MKIKLLIISLLFSVVGFGQVSITATGSYSQDFNTLITSGTGTWVNNSTISNWYASNANITADAGAATANSLHSYGTGTNAERALGSIPSNGTGAIAYGTQFLNSSSTTLTNISVGYTGEQWRRENNTNADQILFYYRVFSTAQTTVDNVVAGWTPVTALDFTAPITGTSILALDGNQTANRVVKSSTALPSLSVANGSYLVIKWVDQNISGNDHGIGIDDVVVSWTVPATTGVSASTLSGFNYVESFGPSGEQNFTTTGSNLTADMVFTAPTNYELSLTSGGVFTNTVSITPSSGSVNAPVFVRLKAGLAANTYNGEDISITSAGATAKTVTCSGTVVRPTISLTPTTLTGFSYVVGSGPSGEQTFTASGINLSADIVLTAPANYEISLTSGVGFSSSINLVPTTGTVSATTIYVRLIAGLSVNVYNGESITATSTNAVNKTVICDGSVSGSLPVINSVLTDSSVYGSAYNYAITVSGAAATGYGATGLPAGLSIDTSTGIIGGTPLVGVGSYNIDITATNGSGSDTETLVLIITAKNLTITGLNADDKVYDRTLTATLSGTPALDGIVGSDDVMVSGTLSATFATAIVGTAKPVTVTNYTLSGAQAANYTVTQPTGLTANITAKSLTVTGAVANNKVYNGTNAAIITGATLVGVIATDDVNITPSGTFASVNVGIAIAVTSTSSISGTDASNYSLIQPTGLSADITQASQTITFGTLGYQYVGAANFNLTATASSGLTITYVSSNPAVATISGNTVTIVGTGTTVITASQAGDVNYTAATSVSQNQLVTTAPCLSNSFTSATFPPAGWLATNVARSISTSDYVTGPAAAIFNMTTGSMTTNAVSNPTQLRFYLGRTTNINAKTLTVEISTTSQVTGFSTIATYDHSNVPAGSYNQYTVDLSAYTTFSNVWIRFVKTSATTAPWRFDDLEVFCGTVWDGSTWSNGTPTLTSFAVINGDYDTTTHGDIDAYNLTVNPTFTTTVTPNHYVTIQNNLTVNGVLNIENNGSLVQINDTGVNTGNISMQRVAFVDYRDYVYWSAPVANFNSANISTTSNNNNLYKWIPTVPGNGDGDFGNWTNGTETMVLGKGYIERGLNNAPLNSPVNFTSTFMGVPNNGIVTTPIARGTYNTIGTYPSPYSPTNATQDDDNWNLLGNPYPSSISADAFLTANSSNLDGFVKIWMHGIAPSTSASDPFYNNYGYNYDPNDYLTYNLSGPSTPGVFDGYIGAGQGFIIRMSAASASTSSTAVFNNSMRSKTYRNDQFYRTANVSSNVVPQGRIWIDLVSSTASSSTLVAYVNGATNGKDQMYDAPANLKANFSIYSLLDGYDRHLIQGRSLPFDQNDLVPLAIKIPSNGNYTIAIKDVDGFFSDSTQSIYLEDKQSNVIHDLRSAPYYFTSVSGEFTQRFVLRYTNQTLGNDQFEVSDNSVKIYASDNSIVINSLVEAIKAYEIYNVLGQTLVSKKQIKVNKTEETSIQKGNQALIVKVTLENGKSFTKKVIY